MLVTKKTHLTTKISYGKVIVRFSGGKKGPEMMKKAMENSGKNANKTLEKYSKHQYSKNDTTQTNNNNNTTMTNTNNNNNNSITTKHDQNNSPKITIGPFQSIRDKTKHVISKKDNNNNEVSTNTSNNNTNEKNQEIDAEIDKLFNQLMKKNKPEISTNTNENNQEISNNTNINNQELPDNTDENNTTNENFNQQIKEDEPEISTNIDENNQELSGNNDENNQEIVNNTTNDILNEDFKAQIENKIKKIFNNDTNDTTELINNTKLIENIKNYITQDPQEFKIITEVHEEINKRLKKIIKDDFIKKKEILKQKTTDQLEYNRLMRDINEFNEKDVSLLELLKKISINSCFKEEQFQEQFSAFKETISYLEDNFFNVPEKILLELSRKVGTITYRPASFKGNKFEKGLEQINHSEKNGAGFVINGDDLKNYKQKTNEDLDESTFILDELKAGNIIGGLISLDDPKFSKMIACCGQTAHMVVGIPKNGKIYIIGYLTSAKDDTNIQLSDNQPLNQDGGKNKPQMFVPLKTICQEDIQNFKIIDDVTNYIKNYNVFPILFKTIENASSDFLQNKITSIPIITKEDLLEIMIKKLKFIENILQKAHTNFKQDLASKPDTKAFLEKQEKKQEKFEQSILQKQYRESLTPIEKFVYDFSLALNAQIKAKNAGIKDNEPQTTNDVKNE